MSREFDVLVIGGGVTAMTMATALIARKLVSPGRVAVVAENIGQRRPRNRDGLGYTRVCLESRVTALTGSVRHVAVTGGQVLRLRTHVRVGCAR
jgi:hypothetical protein